MTKNVSTVEPSENDSEKKPLPISVTVMLCIIVFMSLMVLMFLGYQSFAGKISDNNAQLLDQISSTYGAEHAEWIFKDKEKPKLSIVIKGENLLCEAPDRSQISSKTPLKCTTEKIINPVTQNNQ